jgi:putative nucleotidyltransferase with HDIG domain
MERLRQFPRIQLERYATSVLQDGRKDWDIPHTRAVEFHATTIAERENLDITVMRTVAWLHDLGYYKQFNSSDSSQYDQVLEKKAAHMIYGSEMARQFLNQPEISCFYNSDQIELICHLISVHDKLEQLQSRYEIAFMEADTLGAIDINRVKPSFGVESGWAYIKKDLYGRRLPRFKTRIGIRFASILLPRFIEYFKQLERQTRSST